MKYTGMTFPCVLFSAICNSCRKSHSSRLKTEWLWLRTPKREIEHVDEDKDPSDRPELSRYSMFTSQVSI